MTEPVDRTVAEAFYEAYAARDIARLAPLLDDDVEWTVSGPVDVLPFCGPRRGKPAVLRLIGEVIPQVIDIFRYEPSAILIDGDQVATLNRLWGRHNEDGRVISYRSAHFMRFRDGRVIENLSLLDSFDAAEQVLGHSLTAGGDVPLGADDIYAM